MVDVTIIGGGNAARACSDILSAAGLRLRRGFEFDNEDRSPIILGEIPAALNIARQAVEAGRHLLIANPVQFSAERLGLLYEQRRKAQSLFIWSERRHHPGYRFMRTLMATDPTWQPRYLRHETLLTAAPAQGVANWALVETAAVLLSLTNDDPRTVAAAGAANPLRNANELLSLVIEYAGHTAFVSLGLGEASPRSETLVAAEGRKAVIDELNAAQPIRVISSSDATDISANPRRLSTSGAVREDAARLQCQAFLDSTHQNDLAAVAAEADLWTAAFAVVVATRQSMANGGAPVEIEQRPGEAPGPRLLYSA